MKLGSLFDGIGGFPLAAMKYGITPIWASEIEPFPIKVTKARIPQMRHLGDITKINGEYIEPVDVTTGGSPCQDLSVAGKRAGLKHDELGHGEVTRSGLFMEQIRIIKEMRDAEKRAGRTNIDIRPRFMVWENVLGAFSSNKGEDFRVVLEEVAKVCDEGINIPRPEGGRWTHAGCIMGKDWSIAWRVLDAQFWGVPQRRRRIFLVADFGGQSAPEILFKREGLCRNTEKSSDQRERTSANIEGGVRTSRDRRISELKPQTMRERCGCSGGGKGPLIDVDISGALTNGGFQTLFEPISIENHPADSRIKIDDTGTVQTLTSRMGTGGGNIPMLAIPIHDQATRCTGKRGEHHDGKGNGLGIGEPGDPMNTLTQGDRHAIAYPQIIGNGQVCQTYLQSKAGVLNCMHDQQAVLVPAKAHCLSSKPQLKHRADMDTLIVEDRRTYQKVTGPLMANSHPGSYTGQDAYTDMLIAKSVDCRNLYENEELRGTLQAKSNGGQSLNYQNPVRIGYDVRRLTPLECDRLQGYPDDWTNIEGATDSVRYKADGNSVAIPCVEYVIEGIAMELIVSKKERVS